MIFRLGLVLGTAIVVAVAIFGDGTSLVFFAYAFANAAVVTFGVSRLILWLGRKWITYPVDVVAAHALSLATIFIVKGFIEGYVVEARWGAFRVSDAVVFLFYLPP